MNSKNDNSKSIGESIEDLRSSRESLVHAHEAFYQDSRQFQHETLKTLTQFAGEIQNLKDRLTEVIKVVYGTDNPHALQLQSQIFKRDLIYLAAEIEELKQQIEAHARYHSASNETKSDRGWQLKLAIYTMVLGLAGAAIAGLAPLAQKFFNPTLQADENPWFQD